MLDPVKETRSHRKWCLVINFCIVNKSVILFLKWLCKLCNTPNHILSYDMFYDIVTLCKVLRNPISYLRTADVCPKTRRRLTKPFRNAPLDSTPECIEKMWLHLSDLFPHLAKYTLITPNLCDFMKVTLPLSRFQEIIPAIDLRKIPHSLINMTLLYMVLKSNCNSSTCIDGGLSYAKAII